MQLPKGSLLLLLAAALATPGPAQLQSSGVKHLVVYEESGRFAAWPANHGVWSWDNEILVGFELGFFKDNPTGHDIDYSRPAEHVLARSLDGGETWTLEKPAGLQPPPGAQVAGVPSGPAGRPVHDCDGGIDFSHPGFIVTFRMTSIHDGESRFYYPSDRGKTWEGPCRLPNFGQPGIAARTDYFINGPHDMTVLLTAAKSNRHEGRVICVRTRDGAKTWSFVSYVGPEPLDYAIMPSSVRLGPAEILTAIRRREWIDIYRSNDNGESWNFVNQATLETGGNPPSMVLLPDGRVAVTYGYRKEPYGIRARISKNHGLTWSDEEIILRSDGGGRDLGYPRTVLRPDGKLVSVYYFNDAADRERYIGATIWDADSVR